MKITIALFSVSLFSFSNLLAHDFKHSPGFPAPPSGLKTPGDSHGEIAVASNGEIHVSVQSGKKAGIQVYSPEGKYLRNVKGAPHDFHGFVIHKEKSGEFIYGVGLNTGSLTKMTLDGTIVFQTPVSAIPEKFIGKKKELLSPRFTSCDVAPDGTIIVTDGYGTDNLHLYNADGSYRSDVKLPTCSKICTRYLLTFVMINLVFFAATGRTNAWCILVWMENSSVNTQPA